MSPSYNSMLCEAFNDGLDVIETKLRGRNRGFYGDGLIVIDKRLELLAEKNCIMAEELGHHYTTTGDILDQSLLQNRKQEQRARSWAYERLVPLEGIVEGYYAGVTFRHELAEFLDVTEEFLNAAIKRYQDKYGLFFTVDRYTIFFEPLRVLEIFE